MKSFTFTRNGNKETHTALFYELEERVRYAKTSLSARELLHQAYGEILMAYELEAITKDEYLILNHQCVYDGINNPKYF
jgi:hypothetical protein